MTGVSMADVSSTGVPFSVDGVHIEISGIHDEDEFLKDVVRKEVVNAVKKLSRTTDVSRFCAHVKKSDSDGRRARFDINVKASAAGSDFHADGTEWDLPKAMRNAIDNLEAEIERYVERQKYHTDLSRKKAQA